MYQYGIWEREPSFKSLDNTYIYFHLLYLIHTAWGPKFDSQSLHFIFPLISLFIFRLIELRGCAIEPPQPSLLFIFITFNFSPLAEGLWVRTPTTPL